jgi:hypothetical protein
MPQQAGFRHPLRGQARLAVFLVLLILVPLGFSVAYRFVPTGTVSAQAFLQRPDAKYDRCVRDTAYMRHRHWELLRGVREEVVRYGIRGDVTIDRCRGCHTNRATFCNKCHDAVSLTPDCFQCHYYPE